MVEKWVRGWRREVEDGICKRYERTWRIPGVFTTRTRSFCSSSLPGPMSTALIMVRSVSSASASDAASLISCPACPAADARSNIDTEAVSKCDRARWLCVCARSSACGSESTKEASTHVIHLLRPARAPHLRDVCHRTTGAGELSGRIEQNRKGGGGGDTSGCAVLGVARRYPWRCGAVEVTAERDTGPERAGTET
eukprot:3098714-Rhodomonas_salina.7